ncbi:hypothetical protein ABZP36_020322, partial [Zizania latifolia]
IAQFWFRPFGFVDLYSLGITELLCATSTSSRMLCHRPLSWIKGSCWSVGMDALANRAAGGDTETTGSYVTVCFHGASKLYSK